MAFFFLLEVFSTSVTAFCNKSSGKTSMLCSSFLDMLGYFCIHNGDNLFPGNSSCAMQYCSFYSFPCCYSFFFFLIPKHFICLYKVKKKKKHQKLWLSDIIQISSLGKVIPSYLQDVTTPFPNLSRLEGVTLCMWLSPMVLSKPPNV